MDEMDSWLDNMSEMMTRQEDRSAVEKLEKQKRQQRIDVEVHKASLKYGRAMTPSTKGTPNASVAAFPSKRDGIVDR